MPRSDSPSKKLKLKEVLENEPTTLVDAVTIAKHRDGMAWEWDHVLAEAAKLLAEHVTDAPVAPKVTVAMVRRMRVGSTLVIAAEGRNRTQRSWKGQTRASMLASRLEYKLATRVMMLLDPFTMTLSPVIHITRKG